MEDPSVEGIPYPGAGGGPMPTDEDGWMDCDEVDQSNLVKSAHPRMLLIVIFVFTVCYDFVKMIVCVCVCTT